MNPSPLPTLSMKGITPIYCSPLMLASYLSTAEPRQQSEPSSANATKPGQTSLQSWAEVLGGTAIGFLLSLAAQAFIMPWYGIHTTLSQDTGIVIFFTGISILRGYAVRRFFNWFFNKE